MHSLASYIDLFQYTKRSLTNKIIVDPTLNVAANKFIDSQTSYAKMLAENFENISKYYVDCQTKAIFPKV